MGLMTRMVIYRDTAFSLWACHKYHDKIAELREFLANNTFARKLFWRTIDTGVHQALTIKCQQVWMDMEPGVTVDALMCEAAMARTIEIFANQPPKLLIDAHACDAQFLDEEIQFETSNAAQETPPVS